MKRFLDYAIVASIVWFSILCVRPYWDRYLLQMDVEEAAICATKAGEAEARKFLFKKMQERGRRITDFFIVKDEQKNVYVKLSYTDEIRIAGRTLKQLQFTLDAREMDHRF